MISFLESFALIISVSYAIFILIISLIFLIRFNKQPKNVNANSENGISIIIPYRNEENNILKLWQNLSLQKAINVEIIFINDASQDNSEKIVNSLTHPHFQIKKLNLSDNLSGKKNAIEFGIKHSSYEKILTLDADCIPSRDNWIFAHQNFNHSSTKILGGGVFIQSNSKFWNTIQEIENYMTQVVSFGMSEIKSPIAISGANMSYRKDYFFKMNPYKENKNIASGDDIYFLQSAKKNKDSIMLNLNEDFAVKTSASSIKNYFAQRVRWMRKGSSFRDFTTVLVGLLLFLSISVFLFSTVYQILMWELIPELTISMCLKMGIDFLLLFLISLKFKRLRLVLLFLPAFLFNILAFSFIILLGWILPIHWKDRKI